MATLPTAKWTTKRRIKNGQWTHELLEECNTFVLSLYSVKSAVMYLYGLNMELIDGSSKLEFQTFKISRQFFVRLLVMRRDVPTFFQLICNAQRFLSFSNFKFIFPKNNNYSIRKNVYSVHVFFNLRKS